jgi:hypothetical protein
VTKENDEIEIKGIEVKKITQSSVYPEERRVTLMNFFVCL